MPGAFCFSRTCFQHPAFMTWHLFSAPKSQHITKDGVFRTVRAPEFTKGICDNRVTSVAGGCRGLSVTHSILRTSIWFTHFIFVLIIPCGATTFLRACFFLWCWYHIAQYHQKPFGVSELPLLQEMHAMRCTAKVQERWLLSMMYYPWPG